MKSWVTIQYLFLGGKNTAQKYLIINKSINKYIGYFSERANSVKIMRGRREGGLRRQKPTWAWASPSKLNFILHPIPSTSMEVPFR